MADIRIKDLATTAASTASDDFLAVDGSANGTRKLNAYSPTFGGNLTVSGNQAVAGTLSSWGSAYKALEVGSNASVSVTGNSWFSINNAYNNGSNWVFNTNGYATVLEQNKNNGSHIWYTSNNGTAGGTPTFATLATLTRDGNLSLAGNLTVSGTGLSSVGGGFKVGGTATFTGAGLELQYVAGGGNYGYFRNYNRTSSVYERLYVDGFLTILNSDSGGNVLIGTTTDGGQKLQVSGDAAISGALNVTGNAIAGSGSGFLSNLYYASGWKYVGSGLGAGFYTDATLTRFLVAPNNTGGAGASATPVEFLQVSGTGNATFAGNVTVSGTTVGIGAAIGSGLDVILAGTDGYLFNRKNGYLILGTNNTTALTLDNSQRCILAGALRLNNAYVAGAPTATGYVTIQDSVGNTYKVLVGT